MSWSFLVGMCVGACVLLAVMTIAAAIGSGREHRANETRYRDLDRLLKDDQRIRKSRPQ